MVNSLCLLVQLVLTLHIGHWVEEGLTKLVIQVAAHTFYFFKLTQGKYIYIY